MAKLIYSTIASLDGYIEDASGAFDWSAPDAEVHGFVNDLERPVGTYLYGRRLYETMVYWATAPTSGDDHPAVLDYARIWQAAEKVVYSTTLTTAASERTRIEPAFDPEAVRRLKDEATSDISIGGPALAAQALLDERRFAGGTVHLHYRIT
jgi:dihydrofolate reductase